MARDPIDDRGSTSLLRPNDGRTFRYDRLISTVQDMIVKMLEEVIVRDSIPDIVRSEMPITRKFETAPGAQENVHETYTRLTHEWPHLRERLPAVGVLKPSGETKKHTIGLNYIATVQEPPELVASTAEPYSLPISVREKRTVSVTASPLTAGTVLTATVDGIDSTYTTLAEDTHATAAVALARQIQLDSGYLVDVLTDGNVITLRRWAGGQTFTLAVSAGLAAALVTSPNGSYSTARLVLRSTPRTRDNPLRAPLVTTLQFTESLLEPGEDPSALSAASVARMINNQALYVHAEVVDVGGSPGFRIVTGGPGGGGETPNEVEVLPESTAAVLAEFGFGTSGEVDALTADVDGILVEASDGAFVASDAGKYLTLSLSSNGLDNDGRFEVLSVPSATSLVVDNQFGVPEAASPAEWFLGARNDWLDPTKPPKHRYGYKAEMSIPVAIMADSASVRSELEGLVTTALVHRAQEKLWEVFGPGFAQVQSERDALSQVQIILHGSVRSAAAGAVSRGGADATASVHTVRLDVPVTVWVYVDRPVTHPDGTRRDIQPGDLIYSGSLPEPS